MEWQFGFNRETGFLLGGLSLLAWTLGGRCILLRKHGMDEPKSMRSGSTQRLRRPDGTELQVEFYGPPEAPPLVLTHVSVIDASGAPFKRDQNVIIAGGRISALGPSGGVRARAGANHDGVHPARVSRTNILRLNFDAGRGNANLRVEPTFVRVDCAASAGCVCLQPESESPCT